MTKSSTDAGKRKRKRGQPKRARGDPEPLIIEVPRPRQIDYAAPEVCPTQDDEPVPVDERVLEDHTLLQFKKDTEEFVKCERIVKLELLQHKSIDWGLIETLGERARLEELLGERWRRVLACEGPQYRELTVEFHSTFRHDLGSFDEPTAVSFSLGRQVYEMSIPQFAVAVGFYTEAETKLPTFSTSLRGVFKKPHPQGVSERELATFWETIADGAYTSSIIESSILDPAVRYIHRILSCTLIGRRAGAEKCNQLDIFCLYCILGRREANLATILLSSFSRVRRGGTTARLDLGPYIGRIAASVGVFTRFPKQHLTLGPTTEGYGLHDMRLAGMCPFDDPPRWEPVRQFVRVLPPEGTPAAEALQRGVPPLRQRISFRSERPQILHPLRKPKSIPVTLEEILGRIDRQDQAIRALMIHQGMEIPGFFRDPLEIEAESNTEQEADDHE